MAVAQIFLWRPRPGRLQDFMKIVARADGMIKRNGGRMRVWNTAAGGEPGTVGTVIETADWKAFADYTTKLEADRDWQAFMAEINATRDPTADLVRSQMSVEVPIG